MLTQESIRKLRLVKDAILAEPELYDQNIPPNSLTSCDSPCCIEGWAAWIDNPNKRDYKKFQRFRYSGIGLSMVKSLGITKEQAQQLYDDWPSKNGAAWKKPRTLAAAKDAAKIYRIIY